MDDKEKINLDINMAFVVIAGVFGVFLSIFADAIYDVLTQGANMKLLIILISSGFMSLVFVDFFSFALNIPRDLKSLTFIKLFIKYLQSKFKSDENHH
ncbi:MAG: hypothetical protein KBC12_03460 [Candidatus Pacebacteria bacterium]|nr:hypothetical protein [Candidatus Paceibacterota bacterium]MBP9851313.1 hypothetical protein [Candidatus Paceibacterota bacterium]